MEKRLSKPSASHSRRIIPLSDLLRRVRTDVQDINAVVAEVSANMQPGMHRMMLFEAVSGMQRVQASLDLLSRYCDKNLPVPPVPLSEEDRPQQ